VLREVFPDVSKDHNAFTFEVIFSDCLTLKMKTLREAGSYSSKDTASYSRRYEPTQKKKHLGILMNEEVTKFKNKFISLL
jgi:hypothetical protein